MSRLVLKNVPPGFSDPQILGELAQLPDLVEEATVARKKSFLS